MLSSHVFIRRKKIECTFIHISWITQQFQLRQLNKQSRFWEHTVYIYLLEVLFYSFPRARPELWVGEAIIKTGPATFRFRHNV